MMETDDFIERLARGIEPVAPSSDRGCVRSCGWSAPSSISACCP